MGASASASYDAFVIGLYLDIIGRGKEIQATINGNPTWAVVQRLERGMFAVKLEVRYCFGVRILNGVSNLPHSPVKWQLNIHGTTNYGFPDIDSHTTNAIRKKQIHSLVRGKNKQKKECSAHVYFFCSPIYDRNVLPMIAEWL
jgi:hypothetical protein